MGHADSIQGRCTRHPSHKESTGVCSSCLRERLSQLSYTTTNYRSVSNTMDAYCYYYSNSSSSEASSPPGKSNYTFHHRNASDVMNSMSCMATSDIEHVLTKSRSIAFAPKGRVGEAKFEKKKHGFWSKLLHLKGKKMDKHCRGFTQRFD